MRIMKLIGENFIVFVVHIQVLGFLRQFNDTLWNEADMVRYLEKKQWSKQGDRARTWAVKTTCKSG